jgi:hypothetical protein
LFVFSYLFLSELCLTELLASPENLFRQSSLFPSLSRVFLIKRGQTYLKNLIWAYISTLQTLKPSTIPPNINAVSQMTKETITAITPFFLSFLDLTIGSLAHLPPPILSFLRSLTTTITTANPQATPVFIRNIVFLKFLCPVLTLIENVCPNASAEYRTLCRYISMILQSLLNGNDEANFSSPMKNSLTQCVSILTTFFCGETPNAKQFSTIQRASSHYNTILSQKTKDIEEKLPFVAPKTNSESQSPAPGRPQHIENFYDYFVYFLGENANRMKDWLLTQTSHTRTMEIFALYLRLRHLLSLSPKLTLVLPQPQNKLQLEAIMYDSICSEAFHSYLKKNFMAETYEMWDALQTLTTLSGEAHINHFIRLCSEHIFDFSPSPVCIDCFTIAHLRKLFDEANDGKLQCVPPATIAKAQRELWLGLESSCLPPFYESDFYKTIEKGGDPCQEEFSRAKAEKFFGLQIMGPLRRVECLQVVEIPSMGKTKSWQMRGRKKLPKDTSNANVKKYTVNRTACSEGPVGFFSLFGEDQTPESILECLFLVVAVQ